MGRFRFRGHFTDVDIDLIVGTNPAMKDYAARLASLRLRNGQPVGPRRARGILTRLLTGAFDNIGAEYVGRFDAKIEQIANLRARLADRYSQILKLFDPKGPKLRSLPPELRPHSIAALFDELDKALDDLEQGTSRDGLTDAMDHVDQTHSPADYAPDETRRVGDVEPPGREPDLDLDKLDRPDRPPRGEHDRAALARYRERKSVLGDDVRVRDEVNAFARDWVRRTLGDVAELHRVSKIPDYSEGNLAAIARFSELDPNFSGRGFEVELRFRDGSRFQPDGIRFLDTDGRRFQFLESKEPYTWVEGAFYKSPEGQRKLVDMLHRDAAIAQRLRPNGCVGFQYRTGHPDLDRVLAEAIVDMRTNGIGGAEMLAAPGGD